jgi:hypothetical protein
MNRRKATTENSERGSPRMRGKPTPHSRRAWPWRPQKDRRKREPQICLKDLDEHGIPGLVERLDLFGTH